MNILEINDQLARGVLPPELDFRKKDEIDLDWSRVQYNTFYKTPEFVLERFPDAEAFLNMPGGHRILEAMAANLPSPLEEMLQRQENNMLEECIEEDGVAGPKQADNEESDSTRCAESVVSESGETK